MNGIRQLEIPTLEGEDKRTRAYIRVIQDFNYYKKGKYEGSLQKKKKKKKVNMREGELTELEARNLY